MDYAEITVLLKEPGIHLIIVQPYPAHIPVPGNYNKRMAAKPAFPRQEHAALWTHTFELLRKSGGCALTPHPLSLSPCEWEREEILERGFAPLRLPY